MFRKLKNKLVLINLFSVGMILLLLFLGVYGLISHNFDREAQNTLREVTREAFAPVQPKPPLRPPIRDASFIKTDSEGRIKTLSPNFPFTDEEAQWLMKKADGAQKGAGSLSYDGQSYKFLKTSQGQDTVYAFLNTQAQKGMLASLIFASLVIGIISLLLVFFSSLFLASRALVPVKAAWERQKAFVADASHELRTPLSVIGTNLELVLGNGEESVSSQIKWLENIQAETQRMTKLVNDLLFLARADSGEEALPMDRFDLADMVKKVILPFEPIFSGKGIRLKVNGPDHILYYGNEGRLGQLIAILLDNAIKHTPRGGEVAISLVDAEDFVEIEVSDTGEGIPKEHLDKIFHRFYRVDPSRSRNQGGSGLGLAIAQCIVGEHNGSIAALSKDTPGAVFKITLPKKRN
ncbi:MAG: HAMP domain-containing sensor histidine kinase [Clostridiales bacterium]|jgi:signal transduction histidine kinase|nr:HAMP domain-containing histidine kinase [Eubacteriales bacterium]MDH7567709.1 HAMP domain-containing sensor histidine kinase [Clostridiales bacterium]